MDAAQTRLFSECRYVIYRYGVFEIQYLENRISFINFFMRFFYDFLYEIFYDFLYEIFYDFLYAIYNLKYQIINR